MSTPGGVSPVRTDWYTFTIYSEEDPNDTTGVRKGTLESDSVSITLSEAQVKEMVGELPREQRRALVEPLRQSTGLTPEDLAARDKNVLEVLQDYLDSTSGAANFIKSIKYVIDGFDNAARSMGGKIPKPLLNAASGLKATKNALQIAALPFSVFKFVKSAVALPGIIIKPKAANETTQEEVKRKVEATCKLVFRKICPINLTVYDIVEAGKQFEVIELSKAASKALSYFMFINLFLWSGYGAYENGDKIYQMSKPGSTIDQNQRTPNALAMVKHGSYVLMAIVGIAALIAGTIASLYVGAALLTLAIIALVFGVAETMVKKLKAEPEPLLRISDYS
jgi:hypothetical protein